MILYSNSCSFGAPFQGHTVYPEVVANSLSAKLVNDGIPGSCNRRIIRSTLRSLIQQKKQTDDITALVGLSFISRTELWQPFKVATGNDGDFHPLCSNKIISLDWSNGIANTHIKNIHNYLDPKVREYYKQWLIHLHPESEVSNLLADIIMLLGFAKTNSIKLLVFCGTQKLPGPPDVDMSAPFLQDFVENAKVNDSIIDLWNFSFADYALSLGHRPKDEKLYGLNGHPNEQAHIDFGNYLLKNYVQN
jgi:hypothetical protein